MPNTNQNIRELIDQLKTLELEGPSRGGPYVGILHNDVTRAIVAEGDKIIRALLERLETSSLSETIFIVFCLRELHAKSAKHSLEQLQRSNRFQDVEKDLTLDMQLQFFWRDLDSWS